MEKGLLAGCGKPLPFIDRIVFTMEKEAIPLRTKFLQGYYDSPAIDRSDVGQGFLSKPRIHLNSPANTLRRRSSSPAPLTSQTATSAST